MINAVVVGYGTAGRAFHCYLLGLEPRINLYGVVSGSAEKRREIQKDPGCRTFAEIDEALSDKNTELVILATPNSTHAKLAVKAMNAGKNLVTDKVMCLSLNEFDAMRSAAEKNNVMLSCFQNRRWDGDYLTVQKIIRDGTLGDVRWLEMAWQGFSPWGGWRGKAEMGGGKLYDLGAHLVDQACMIFPAPVKSVYCRMHHDYNQTDTESEALVVISFADGKTAVCDFSSMAAISKPRFYLRGRKGTYRKYGLDPQENAMKAGNIDMAEEDPEKYGIFSDGESEITIPTVPGNWRNYYQNIAAVLLDRAEPAVKMTELRREIAVIEAAFKSAETGKVVYL